jgi:hypothetical protein
VWQKAMMEEYASIMKNDVWEVVPRPEGKVVGSKWIYKVKHAADKSVYKYKACFVAKGFSQQEGVDYEETFAPVARYSSIRTVVIYFISDRDGMARSSDGREDCFPQWSC